MRLVAVGVVEGNQGQVRLVGCVGLRVSSRESTKRSVSGRSSEAVGSSRLCQQPINVLSPGQRLVLAMLAALRVAPVPLRALAFRCAR